MATVAIATMVGGLNKSQWQTDYDSEWRWISASRARALFRRRSSSRREGPIVTHGAICPRNFEFVDLQFFPFRFSRALSSSIVSNFRRERAKREAFVGENRTRCVSHTYIGIYKNICTQNRGVTLEATERKSPGELANSARKTPHTREIDSVVATTFQSVHLGITTLGSETAGFSAEIRS